MDIGTFLLMQSPSARPSQEVYARGIEQAQAAETLGYRNVWLGEHHFSTYGLLSRPCQLATYIAAKTTKLRVGTAVIVVVFADQLHAGAGYAGAVHSCAITLIVLLAVAAAAAAALLFARRPSPAA